MSRTFFQFQDAGPPDPPDEKEEEDETSLTFSTSPGLSGNPHPLMERFRRDEAAGTCLTSQPGSYAPHDTSTVQHGEPRVKRKIAGPPLEPPEFPQGSDPGRDVPASAC